jgi:hypothetical protein
MHVKIPVLGRRLPTGNEHKTQRQAKCGDGRPGLQVSLEHGDPPFAIAATPAIDAILLVAFAATIFSPKEPMDTSFGCQRAGFYGRAQWTWWPMIGSANIKVD